VVAIHLTPGKLNAVRAAFKAGVKPSQIARQFGLSQSDVRKALAIDAWLLDVGLPSDLGELKVIGDDAVKVPDRTPVAVSIRLLCVGKFEGTRSGFRTKW
jgi:hypothetical protein